MARRTPLLIAVAALLVLAPPAPAEAFETGKYRYVLEGRIRAMRAADLDGDGRAELVVLTEPEAGETGPERLVILRSKATPKRGTFFDAADARSLALDGPLANAGAMCIGRFGPKGEMRIRFLGPDGMTDVGIDAKPLPRTKRHETKSLLRRGIGRRIAIWDGVADLDGDGKDEVWMPAAEGNGQIVVVGSTRTTSKTLTLETKNIGSTSDEQLLVRNAYVPRLVPTDLDGDGMRELTALEDETLLVWQVTKVMSAPPPYSAGIRIPLPFLAPDPDLPAEQTRTPRIQLEDVDGDGTTDLLVTLITGRRDKLGSLRTTLFHYAGPIMDDSLTKLVKPSVRIDTESVALHPTFVDLDGDGDKDYVGDSIRGTLADLLAQMMGRDPVITYVGFRFDAKQKTYETTPYFTVERRYALSQAMSNVFARSAWIDTDFDGDGLADLLDIGDLTGVEILRAVPKQGAGPGDPLGFAEKLMPKVPVKDGLVADGLVADLTGDGVMDIVVRSNTALYIVVPKRSR
ncbi:MAG: VCBS repeat-containing protein [Planctomycetota bacterium]|nr:VCBS repeat-containing protein [Planctomycetota bacterium]